jgi:thrombospondin motif-containing protein 9
MRIASILAATTMLFVGAPSLAQSDPGTPAFRVPMGSGSTSSSAPSAYAWMESVGTCSNSCGDGTRTTSYQCQDVSSFDFSGSGYGAAEAESLCSASPKPVSKTRACTNFSGCSYDWVRPAPSVQILPKPNPAGGTFEEGAIATCSYAKRTFAPYCQRDGSPAVTMASGDHAFCRNDTPDYDDVAAGEPDALGYDRTTDVSTGCVAGGRDHKWVGSAWVDAPLSCGVAPTRSRTLQCIRKFDGSSQPDAKCAGVARPAENETTGPADVSSCGYAWEPGAWSAYGSSCSDSTTRTRSVVCRRSDGTAVSDAQCSGTKPSSSETGSNLTSCDYDWTAPSAWTYGSGCSASTTRTRTTSCRRSDGTTVADSFCSSKPKPSTSESGVSNYEGCTYAPRDQGRSACSAEGTQQQYWDCTRSDGQTGYPASYCGKANPENLTCTPPAPTYTYAPVNRGESACSGGQKNVYWDCTRNDGATGFPASMCGKTNPEVQGCTMPVTYTPRNRGETACSGGRKDVYWDCVGSDGSVAPASSCGKLNPESQSCTMPVTYSPRYQGESACSGGQKNVYWDCLGSDGSVAPASACGKTNPEVQSCAMPVTYSWQAGGWSGYNSTCSSSATRTRSVWCQGSDGQTYGDASCGGGKPSSSESTAVYSGCSYTSEAGQTGACVNGTSTTPLQCRRSDGILVANSNCGTGDTRTSNCQMPVSCSAPTSGRVCSGGAQIWAVTPDMGVDYETYYAQCLNGSQSRCVSADTKEYVYGYVEGAIRCYSGGTATGTGSKGYYSDGDNSFGKVDESRSKSCS